MIFVPVALVVVSIALFIIGLLKDSVALLAMSAAAAAVTGLAVIVIGSLRRAMEEKAAQMAGVPAANPVPVAAPVATPAPVVAATPLIPAGVAPPTPIMVPVGAPPPPGYVAYVPAPVTAVFDQQPTSTSPFAPPAGSNPIAGYDDLKAVDIVDRIKTNGLRPEELDAVRRYELDHGARKTILDVIEKELDRAPGP